MSDKSSPLLLQYHHDAAGPVPSPGQVAFSVTVATTPPQAATPGPPPMTPPTSSPTTPQPIPSPGPQPVDPNPAPPRISAAELALLTEAAATKNGTFQCTLCHKQFGYKNGLIRHVRLTHVGEKPYQCNICNRRFGYKHILMEHQNLHFGNRPYACTMCDKKFAARSNLIQHRMVHKRPFNCSMCNKRFDREDQLKKHLFAHPQSLLTCNTCKYTAANQTDLNAHMLEKHQPELESQQMAVTARAAVMAAVGMTELQGQPPPPDDSPHNGTPPSGTPTPLPEDPQRYSRGVNGYRTHEEEDDKRMVSDIDMVQRQIEPITPPHTTAEHLTLPQALSPGGHLSPGQRALLEAAGRGQRIDAICHQLSSGIVPPFLSPYHGVIVKKETMEEGYEENGQSASPGMHQQYIPHSSIDYSRSSHTPISFSSHVSIAGSAANNFNSILPPPIPSIPPVAALSPDEKNQRSSALPGIHEVFSRRVQKLPPFGNFGVPNLLTAGSDNRLPLSMPPELTLSMMAPPPTSFPSTNAGIVNPTQRPTAQLPPITQVLHQTKDQAVQHSAPIPGFPSLDDVLSYYMSQGKLFKCQHCNILFFERGMYFLHASLHGPSNPWECSICHKICSDKNEFTLHFVNQQHNS